MNPSLQPQPVWPLVFGFCLIMTSCAVRDGRSQSAEDSLGVVNRTADPADISSPLADPPELTSGDMGDLATLDLNETATEGSIDYARQRIRYALAIARPSTVTVMVEGHGLDPTVAIFDESGSRLGFDDDGGQGTNARLRRSLQTGNYIIEVAGYGRSTGSFALTVR